MSHSTNDAAELRERFKDQGISVRHLAPPWFRLYRKLGLNPKLPLFLNFAEHLWWEGVPILVINTLGYLAVKSTLSLPLDILWWLYAPALVIPFINWLIRRRIRARIGQ